MSEINEAEVIQQSINRDVQMLSDQNKMARRRALEKISKETLEKTPAIAKEVLKIIFNDLYKNILKLLNDPVDRTRETALKLIMQFCKSQDDINEYLPYIVPMIHQRLVSDEEAEPTEEIRLLLIESIVTLIDLSGEKTGVFVDEFIQILQTTLVDSFAEVRKESCSCVKKLAVVAPQQFYHQGEALIKPLLKTLSHQHNKVRSVVIETIGVVILGTSGKSVDDVFSHLAQRTFDHSGIVRMALIKVVGKWLLELRDRYSFFPKLLSILLSGFSDELPDIVEKSKDLFNQAGKQYEEENEKDFKEKKVYCTLKHFEDLLNYERPNLGCRVLVQRNFSKVLPAIINDITDWTPATRIKSASLLYHLVYFCEDHVTMHMELLSQGLYKAVKDEEKEVVNKVMKTAELVGLFVEPQVYTKLILPYLESVAASPRSVEGVLKILSCYVKAASYRLIANEMNGICKAISSPEICSTVDKSCQESLLCCTDVIIQKPGVDHADFGHFVFRILLNVISLTNTLDTQTKVTSQLDELAQRLNIGSRKHLFEMYGLNIANELQANCDQWTSQSPDFHLYVALLAHSNDASITFLNVTIDIFKRCSDVSREPEMRQKMFLTMSQLVILLSKEEKIVENFRHYSLSLIKDVILPNCVWQAGRTAAAVRSVAVSFLWALLQSHIVTDQHLSECFKDVHTQIIACLEDYNETTRLVTVKVLYKLLRTCGSSFEVEQLHVIYPELLKRLNDSSDEIRICATRSLSAYFSALPENYDKDFFKVHLEHMFKTLLVHLDDPQENVQEAVFECLKNGVCIHAGLLKIQSEDSKIKHRKKKYCDELIKLCENELRES